MERENVGLVSEQTGFVAKAVLIFQKNLNHVTQRVWFRCHMAHREGF